MSGRAAFAERFWDRLVRLGLECRSQFVKQVGNVIVERRNVEAAALKGVAAPVAATARVMAWRSCLMSAASLSRSLIVISPLHGKVIR